MRRLKRQADRQLTRNEQGLTKGSLRAANAGGILRSRAEAQEDPRQMEIPGACTRAQGLLQLAMEPLHHAVRLGVVSCGAQMAHTQLAAPPHPRAAQELAATVGGDGVRHAITRDPAGDEGVED